MQPDEKSRIKVFIFKILIVIVAISLFMMLAVGSIFMLFIGVVTLFEPAPEPEENLVYVIDLYGQVQEAPRMGMGQISPRYVREQLNRVKSNAHAEAVVFRVNSPGGTVGASQEIASMIDDFELPTVVSMADNVTSGGYYISAASDSIIAQPTSMTGSIGVISVVYNLEELYDKLGIEVEVVKSGEHKDMGFEGLDEDEKALLQRLSDEMYDNFVRDVAKYRNLDEEVVYEAATGEVMTGRKAKEKALVDELGGLDKAVEKAGELAGIEEPHKVRLTPEGLLDSILPFLLENPGQVLKEYVQREMGYQAYHGDEFSKAWEQQKYWQMYEKTREIPPVEFRYQHNF